MIIKVTTIGSSHGANAIRYAMEKNRKDSKGKPEKEADMNAVLNAEERPFRRNTSKDAEDVKSTKNPNKDPFILASNGIHFTDYITGRPTAHDVWTAMNLQRMESKHHIKDGFFRIEICPSANECRGWRPNDWQQLLDDAIRHLDSTDYKNKSGKVVGKHTDIANAQYVAAIHRDTDNWHIHLIVNRITMNDELQDANRVRERGMIAANSLAMERGWRTAESIGRGGESKRKKAIHDDAIEILRKMSSFEFDEYFKQMRSKGWIVETKQDSKGIYRGYSVGEQLYKKNGENSSVVMYQSSKLGFGRDLMVSKLPGTWRKLHALAEQDKIIVAEKEKNVEVKNVAAKVRETNSVSGKSTDDRNNTQNYGVLNASRMQHPHSSTVQAENVVQIPRWKCSARAAKQNWNAEEVTNVRIPDAAFEIIDELVKPIGRLDYWDKDEDIPSQAAMVAVAVFEFCTAADVPVSGGGGGGSNDNDLRWDGKTADDFKKLASNAAAKALSKCTAHLTKRSRGYRR